MNLKHATTTAAGMGLLPNELQEISGQGALDRALAKANLPYDVVEDFTLRIPLASMVRLFEEAGRLSDNPVFGLQSAMKTGSGVFGTWFHYATEAPNLRIGIQRLSWAITLFQNGPSISLVEQGQHPAFVYHVPKFPEHDNQHHADHNVIHGLQFLRRFLGAEWVPKRIRLPYSDRGMEQSFQNILPVDLMFGCPAMMMFFDRSELDKPPLPEFRQGGHYSAIDVGAKLHENADTFALALEANILLEMLDGLPTIDVIARRMELSTRTMQRKLALEGVSFREKLLQVRHLRAMALLKETTLEVSEIAQRLGYTETSNFTRAFKTMTDATPTRWRRDNAPTYSTTQQRAGA